MVGDGRGVDFQIVPFEAAWADGFRSLVVDTLREFGFEPDPVLDADLDDPAATYAALWLVLSGFEVVGSVGLRRRRRDARAQADVSPTEPARTGARQTPA